MPKTFPLRNEEVYHATSNHVDKSLSNGCKNDQELLRDEMNPVRDCLAEYERTANPAVPPQASITITQQNSWWNSEVVVEKEAPRWKRSRVFHTFRTFYGLIR